jgi:hypothetical protein
MFRDRFQIISLEGRDSFLLSSEAFYYKTSWGKIKVGLQCGKNFCLRRKRKELQVCLILLIVVSRSFIYLCKEDRYRHFTGINKIFFYRTGPMFSSRRRDSECLSRTPSAPRWTLLLARNFLRCAVHLLRFGIFQPKASWAYFVSPACHLGIQSFCMLQAVNRIFVGCSCFLTDSQRRTQGVHIRYFRYSFFRLFLLPIRRLAFPVPPCLNAKYSPFLSPLLSRPFSLLFYAPQVVNCIYPPFVMQTCWSCSFGTFLKTLYVPFTVFITFFLFPSFIPLF